MRNSITLKKLNGLVVEAGSSNNEEAAAAFTANMMAYGFAPTKELYQALTTLNNRALGALHKDVIQHLKEAKGAHVQHRTMYPNFPRQVMEASDLELFVNALVHYWTSGWWTPDHEKLPREFAFETVDIREIGLVTEDQFLRVFTSLLSSNDSISDEDKKIVQWFLNSDLPLIYPETIPYKENLCMVAAICLEKGNDITPVVKTATDVLRIITHLSGGDISLASNTKYKSFPRRQRRLFARLLENVATAEDLQRHRNKWVKLFHALHIGDHSARLHDLAKIFRENRRTETFNSQVEQAIREGNVDVALSLLSRRPGDFARRLDHLLRRFGKNHADLIMSTFSDAAEKLPTRVIAQLKGHLKGRNSGTERVVFPKGKTQKARIIPAFKGSISEDLISTVNSRLDEVLRDRFAALPALGKVWIDPDLQGCPLPTGQRSASTGSRTVARGTRLPFGDETKNTLRLFIYWVGQDIDLSATLHDESFKMIQHISYTNLRSSKYKACHSGDITYAPDGASEFIDITIDKAAKFGARYVAMNVLVYSGPNFSEHETCFAGWMTRSKPQSNEIYDAKTVEHKVDLTLQSRNAIPVVFDLVERKAIWTDLATPRHVQWGGNNIESNRASIESVLRAITGLHNKTTLHELLSLHAESRGEIVSDREDADVVFGLSDANVTPYDIMRINDEFLS